jgi:hypothetical protein
VQLNTLFMGDVNSTYNAWTGGTDNGEPIPFFVMPAFSYFKEPTRKKLFQLGNTLFKADVQPLFRAKLLVDFNQAFFFAPLAPVPAKGNLWDVALWDAATWDDLVVYSNVWYALAGMGYSATQIVYGISNGSSTQIITHAYQYELGGLL